MLFEYDEFTLHPPFVRMENGVCFYSLFLWRGMIHILLAVEQERIQLAKENKCMQKDREMGKKSLFEHLNGHQYQ